jgi:hypothetical protein
LPRLVFGQFRSPLVIREFFAFLIFIASTSPWLSWLIDEENRGKGAACPESSTEEEETSDSEDGSSSDSSDDSNAGGEPSAREEGSPKVDV